jgi:hypothetical protein
VGVTQNCHGPKWNLPSTFAVELQLRVSLKYVQLFQWTGDTTWLFNIHFMQLFKELIKPCSILLTSSLCSLSYLKSPLRCFRASLYRNSTPLFSLCNKHTLISVHFWFLCHTLFCYTDLHNNIFSSCQIIGCTVHPVLGADCIFLYVET